MRGHLLASSPLKVTWTSTFLLSDMHVSPFSYRITLVWGLIALLCYVTNQLKTLIKSTGCKFSKLPFSKARLQIDSSHPAVKWFDWVTKTSSWDTKRSWRTIIRSKSLLAWWWKSWKRSLWENSIPSWRKFPTFVTNKYETKHMQFLCIKSWCCWRLNRSRSTLTRYRRVIQPTISLLKQTLNSLL